jgi:putative membrane protein
VKKRSLKELSIITIKGMAMGAADVVPGVSGGTIAFISGIYDELLLTIKNVTPSNIIGLFKNGIKETWIKLNGAFITALLFGISLSILTLAQVVLHFKEVTPILLWSFFFGLILASIYFVLIKIKSWSMLSIPLIIIGTIISYGLTSSTVFNTPNSSFFIFIAGVIAISAMILPGISGSFLLLILGKYEFILTAIKTLNISVIIIFGLGCLTGLISTARGLTWTLKRFHDGTICFLTGFMIGALSKLWPWKKVMDSVIDHHGELIPLVEKNISPSTYHNLTGLNPMLLGSLACCLLGAVAIGILQTLSQKED